MLHNNSEEDSDIPQDILQAAKTASLQLLPEKHRHR